MRKRVISKKCAKRKLGKIKAKRKSVKKKKKKWSKVAIHLDGWYNVLDRKGDV